MTRYAPTRLDGDDGSMPVSQRVVYAVATEIGTDPMEMANLYDVVDPESLDALFAPTKHGSRRAVGSVSFRYAGCVVIVHADGDVEVTAEDGVDTPQRSDSAVPN